MGYDTKAIQVNLLVSNLRKEETNMNESNGPGQALLVRGKLQFKQGKFNKGRPDDKKANSKCKWCNQAGHWWKECPSRPVDQKPADLGKRKPRRGDNKPESTDRAERALCATTLRNDPNVWCVDSGASSHMTGRRDLIDNYKILDEPCPVTIANGDVLHAFGIESVRAVSAFDNKPLRFKEVYHVPGMAANLFSIGAATDNGFRVNFEGSSMTVLRDSTIVATGSKIEAKLYKLDVKIPMTAKLVRAERTLDEWHAILGHAASDKIKQMARDNVVRGLKIVEETRHQVEGCGDCQAGKGHRASHPSSQRQRVTEVLERIHMDLVGPIKVPSVGGQRFFILLRDEYSTHLFVEFMKNKGEVADILKTFVNTVSNITQRRVRFFRSEFNNAAVKTMRGSPWSLGPFTRLNKAARQNALTEQ